MFVSRKISSGENYKYFIGYLHNKVVFLIKNDDLLETYNTIWDKFSPDIKKEFNSDPVCNKNSLEEKGDLQISFRIFVTGCRLFANLKIL